MHSHMHAVTQRRRVRKGAWARLGLSRRRLRLGVAGVAALAIAGLGGSLAQAATESFGFLHVGETTAKGQVVSDDQFIKPIGDRLLFTEGKFMASTVSPDGTHLAALTTDQGIALTIVNLNDYKIQQTAGTATDADLKINSSDVGQEGPTYSPDGKFLWMPQINGYDRFPVNPDGSVGAPTTITIPAVDSKDALAAQAVFSPDGSTVYAVLNGQNRVVAIDESTGDITNSWDVGNAPRDMVMIGDKLYVSNEGGRPAQAGDTTMASYGTEVVANPKTWATASGTVSVIDTSSATAPVDSINVGLHPTALHVAKGALFVTDTESDEVSVINTATNKVVQTISTKPWASASVGYEPDAVTLTSNGHLLVSLGRANAIAVYRYTAPQRPVSYIGLLPTDYYPENLALVGGKVVVTNTRGIDDEAPAQTISEGPGTTPATAHNTHSTTATLTRFQLPSDVTIRTKLTAEVFAQNGWTSNDVQRAKGQKAKPVPVPARLGDPSTIKHVFLIIKENRTYDQVFGDDPRGNGDPSLAQFGENVTPNQHALERQFGLYDNFYDMSTNSAEGHNWLLEADNPEYMESQAGAYVRSYNPNDDALGVQRSGWIWDDAKAAGKTARVWGEFTVSNVRTAGSDYGTLYCDAKNMDATGDPSAYPGTEAAAIPSLNAVMAPNYLGEGLDVPDLWRYEMWKKDFETNGPANLNIVRLLDNHTGGPVNPVANVADNDLAVGKLVDTISHSKYWKDSAIFVVEDDTQNGVDHVDGMRAPVEVISPWAARTGVVDSHYYTQINMLRTIEQILGMQPMNQKDSAATPIFGAFTKKPNYAPFNAVPNRIPLTYGLTTAAPPCGYDQVAAKYAKIAPTMAPLTIPASQQKTAQIWKQWSTHQRLTGPNAQIDYAPPALMNRYTWYQEYGYTKPYPGDSKILTPSQVPGGYIPSPDSDG